MVIVYKVVAEGFSVFCSYSVKQKKRKEIFISADNKQSILSQIWGLAVTFFTTLIKTRAIYS